MDEFVCECYVRHPWNRPAFNFALCHNFTQLVTSPTRIPDRDSDGSYLLDLFLTSHPDFFQHSVESPLGTSDHCVVSLSTCFTSSRHEGPYHRTVLRYRDADWDGFRSFIADIPKKSLSSDPTVATKEISEWIQVGIEACVPSKTYQMRSVSQGEVCGGGLNKVLKITASTKSRLL